jgi:hypothetical protein
VQKLALRYRNSRVFLEIFAAYPSFVRRQPTTFKRAGFPVFEASNSINYRYK